MCVFVCAYVFYLYSYFVFCSSLFRLVHCSWWFSLESHQCLLIVHFFLCRFFFLSSRLVLSRLVAMPIFFLSHMHFLQMNILIIQKEEYMKKITTYYDCLVSDSELRNRWSTQREWWSSISEKTQPSRTETIQQINEEGKIKQTILKWNAWKK